MLGKVSKVDERRALEDYLAKLEYIQQHDSVDYSETPEQQQARLVRAKKDYAYFVDAYFPHYARTPSADFHLKAANTIKSNPRCRVVLEWARGHAKSTHADVFIPIWLMLFHNSINMMVLVSKSDDHATRLLSDIKAELEANPQLAHDFGELKNHGSWADDDFKSTNGTRFVAKGKRSPVRGMRNGPYRPDYVVLDDADDDEEVQNPLQVDKSLDQIRKAIIPMMDEGVARFVIVNNRIANYSILSHFASNPKFTVIKVNALLPDGTPSWPAKFSVKFFADREYEIGSAAFATEYMNNPSVEGKIFQDKYIQWSQPLHRNRYDRIVAWWDVAYSEAETADCNAIVVVGLIGLQKHVLAIYCQQSRMELAAEWIHNYQDKLPQSAYVEWYVESQFWNDAVILALNTVAIRRGKILPLIFGERPKGNKFSRIMQMLPTFQRGEVFFNELEKFNNHYQRAINQIKAVHPNSRAHDDAPDALASAIAVLESAQSGDDHVPIIGSRKRSRDY